MKEEQKLSRVILGLEGTLAKEVNALRPATLADALVKAKAKLLNFQTRKRSNPFPTSRSSQPQKTNEFNKQNSKQGFTNPMVAKPNVHQVKANALHVNQSGRQIQCFECQQWGHKKADFPNKENKKKTCRPPLPAKKEAYLG